MNVPIYTFKRQTGTNRVGVKVEIISNKTAANMYGIMYIRNMYALRTVHFIKASATCFAMPHIVVISIVFIVCLHSIATPLSN